MKNFYLFIFSLIFISGLSAEVLNVPAEYATIQEGINAANQGDIVLVAEGRYFENINFMGKEITVTSHFFLDKNRQHIKHTIIDGSKPVDPLKGSVVSFVSGETINSTLTGFTITGGSGLYIFDEDDGEVRFGGGIVVMGEGIGATIENNIIEHNYLKGVPIVTGAGIGVGPPLGQNNYVIIRKNIIRLNTLDAGHTQGAGIAMFCGGVIKDNLVSKNKSIANMWGSFGVGISVNDFSESDYQVEITGNTIENNKAITPNLVSLGVYGTGIDLHSISAIVENNTIAHNRTETESITYGPGMRVVYSDERTIIKNNTFKANLAAENSVGLGGGLFLVLCRDGFVCQNRFLHNTASYGGGMYAYKSGMQLENNILYQNYAAYGGAIFTKLNPTSNKTESEAGPLPMETSFEPAAGSLQDGSQDKTKDLEFSRKPLVLVNNTLTDNAAEWGGGIYLYYAEALVMNSIVWNNKAEEFPQIAADLGIFSTVYSDIQDGWPGEGNIDSAPQFADQGYHLLATSPCIGIGTNNYLYNKTNYSCPNCDYDGFLRPNPSGSMPDMGAMESPLGNPQPDLKTNEIVKNTAYPNPFNPTTVISYQLPALSQVDLSIYNLLGQKVSTLVSRKQNPGNYRVEWNASGFSSGVYFYRLTTDNSRSESRKLILMK